MILAIALLLVPGSMLLSVLKNPQTATAAPSTYLNFQARLLNTSGNLVPDGLYNIEFKIYDASTSSGSSQGSCTGDANCEWVETYYDTNGVTAGNDFRVNVVNGYFSVNLGSRAAFSGIDWSSQLWITMNIGGSTQTATPTYDGQMTPRIQLTAVPLAFVANNVASGNTNAASTNTNDISIKTGDAAGTTSNSGNISIDAGTATGTKGTISLGATNASALILGRTGLTTTNTGSLSVTQTLTAAGTGTGLSVTNNATIGGVLTLGSALIGSGASTGTTGTTSGVGGTNVTTITLASAGSFANNDVILVDNTGGSGQDYYTRIVSGGGTTTLTVSPAVSYGTAAGYTGNATITKYTVQSIGATSSDYTTLSNRFFQGYFLGGIVTGAGSTIYSDGRIQSSNPLNINATSTIIQNTVDSTASLAVNNAAGASVLSVDTTSYTTSLLGNLVVNNTGWVSRTSAQDNTWNGVVYGNGMYVAVSQDGTNRVMTSPDGITWTVRTAAAAQVWRSVTYGNGVFVAVSSDGGTQHVMTSPDGITWTLRNSAQDNPWVSVTYGNNLFVAVATTGTNQVMTSPDGITWTVRTASSATTWGSVTYGNSLYVAVTSGSANVIMTSPDGITWTTRTTPGSLGDSRLSSVTYGNGTYVISSLNGVMSAGFIRFLSSPDGITWTAQTVSYNSWSSVTYGNGVFAAVAPGGATSDRIITSPDGATWTAKIVPVSNSWNAVTFGNGQFVAVSTSGTGNRVMTAYKGDVNGSPTTALLTVDTTSKTIVIGVGNTLNNQGATLNTAKTLFDYPSGGTVATAANTVDNYTTFLIPQSTAGQTLSLPSPTNTTSGRIVYILNTGTTSFIMHNTTIGTTSGATFIWNGSAWVSAAGGGGTQFDQINAYKSTNTTYTNGTTLALAFDSERFDTNNLHDPSTNPSRFTAKKSGYYTLSGGVGLTSTPAAPYFQVAILKNGSSYLGISHLVNGQYYTTVSTGTIFLSAGDYIELLLANSTGGTLTTYGGDNGTFAFSSFLNMSQVPDTAGGTGSGSSTSPTVLSATADTSQTCTISTNCTYDAMTITLTPGTWVVDGYATMLSQSAADGKVLSLYNVTDSTEVPNARSAELDAPNTTTYQSFSTSTIMTVTSNKVIKLYGIRNGASQVAWDYPNAGLVNTQRLMAYSVSGGYASSTLQSAYDIGNTLVTSTARDINFTLADTATDANLVVNIAGSSSGLFAVQGAGVNAFTVNGAGQVLFKNISNSASALRVQNLSGSNIFSVDTTAGAAVLGQASTQTGKLTLQNSTNANTVSISSGVTSASYSLTLPITLGSTGQCLKLADNSGTLIFADCGSGGSGSGSSGAASVHAYQTSTQAITGPTNNALNFQAERQDTTSMHDNVTNNSRFYAPTSGNYIVSLTAGFTGTATTGRVGLTVMKNGTTHVVATNVAAGASNEGAVTGVAYLNAGDYVEATVYNGTNGTVVTSNLAEYATEFSMMRLDGGSSSSSGGGSASYAKVYNNASQNHTNNGGWQVLAMNSEELDTDGYHDTVTNNSRVTALTSGLYIFNATVDFAANATGTRGVSFAKNGAIMTGQIFVPANTAFDTSVSTSAQIYLNSGDYVELQGYQSSGGTLAMSYTANQFPYLSISKVTGGGGSTVAGSSGQLDQASAYKSTNTSVTTATSQVLAFDTERFDNNNLHSTSTNPARFTAQHSGTYTITGGVGLTTALTGTGYVQVGIAKNSFSIAVSDIGVGSAHTTTATGAVYLNAGDYIEMYAYNATGGTVTVQAGDTSNNQFSSYLNIAQLPDSYGTGSGNGSAYSGTEVYNNADLTNLLVNNTWTTVTFNSERQDTGNYHSTSSNTSRLVAPVSGMYYVHGNVNLGTNTTGNRIMSFNKNGGVSVGTSDTAVGSAAGSYLADSTQVYLNAGDYLEMLIFQNSGSAMTVPYFADYSPNFGMSLLNGSGGGSSSSGTSGGGASFVSLNHNTTQGMVNNTLQAVVFNTELQDTDGYHDTSSNTSRVTVPTSGLYSFSANVRWPVNATGARDIYFRVNGGGTFYGETDTTALASNDTITSTTTSIYLNAGDYVELIGFQNSGSTLTLASSVTNGAPTLIVTKINGGNGSTSASGAGGTLDQARVYNNAASSSIPTSTNYYMTLNSERYDNNNLHSTSSNTDRFTIAHSGYYQVAAHVGVTAVIPGGRVQLALVRNGVDTIGISDMTVGAFYGTVTATYYFNAGDYVQANVANGTGSSITLVAGAATGATYAQEFSISQLPDSAAGGISLQSAYDIGNTITSTDGRDLKVTLADTTTDANLIVNVASGSTSRFAVQYNGVDTFSISNNASSQGAALFKNAVDNTSAFQIQDAAGNAALRVDTTNDLIVTNFSIEALGQYNNANGGIGQTQNLILYSEQFDNAAWTKTNVTATANAVNGPDNYASFGSNTAADTLTSTSAGGTTQQTYTTTTNGSYNYSVWVKAASGTQPFQLRIDSTGATPTTGTAASFTATTTWQRFNVTQAFTGTPSNIKPTIIITNNSSGIYAYGAQLSQSTLPLVYSRTTAVINAQNYGVISNGGVLAVSLNASDVPLTIIGAPSQSGNLASFKNSAGNTLVAMLAGGGITLDTPSGNNLLQYLTNGSNAVYLGVSNTAGNIINGSAVGDFMVRTTSKDILFSTDSGATTPLIIKASGAVGIGGSVGTKLSVTTSTSLDGLYITDGSRFMRYMAGTVGTGSFNGTVQANDNALIFSGGSSGTGALSIGQWGGSAGLRIDGSNIALNGSVSGNLTGGALNINRAAINADTSARNFEVYINGNPYFQVDTNGVVCLRTGSSGNNCGGTKNLGVFGTIGASGAITASTTPDLAETIPAAPDVETADVVSADPNNAERAVKSSTPYDTTALGVVSDGTSSFMINSRAGNLDAPLTGVPLTLVGRVQVKITGENGPVHPGDYLTSSSTPGYAMKATHAGPTIGKALGFFNGTTINDKSTVLVFVGLGYYAGPDANQLLQDSTIGNLTATGTVTTNNLGVTGTATITNLVVTGTATVETLHVTGEADFSGNLNVQGTTVLKDLIVTGDTDVKQLSVERIITKGVLPTAVLGASTTITGQGSSYVLAGNDTAGTVSYTSGTAAAATLYTPAYSLAAGDQVTITFNKPFTTAPRIALTAKDADSATMRYFVTNTTTGFTIHFLDAPAAATTYNFDYIVIQ